MRDNIYFNFELHYFKNSRFGLALIKFSHEGKSRLQLSFHTAHKLIHITNYEDDWGLRKMKHLILWKNYK